VDRHVIVSRPPHAKRTREMPRSRVDKSVGKRIGRTDERGKSPSPAKPAAIEDGSPKFAESPEESAPPSPPLSRSLFREQDRDATDSSVPIRAGVCCLAVPSGPRELLEKVGETARSRSSVCVSFALHRHGLKKLTRAFAAALNIVKDGQYIGWSG
jgi:hypothetical protein